MDSIEKFAIITKACVAVYLEDSLTHNKVKDAFELYEDLAKKLHMFCLLMKSQKKIEMKNFDNKLLK